MITQEYNIRVGKRSYDRIVKELEIAHYLQNEALRETLKHTELHKQDFKYLVIANLLTRKRGYFEIKDIEFALRATCYAMAGLSVNRMIELGYIELIKGRKYGSRVGRKYATTGTAIYLVRKYTDVMRRLLKEADF